MPNRQTLMVEALKAHIATHGRPQIPAGGDLLWKWFMDLSRTRTYHAAGPNPISFAEMHAYQRLRRVQWSQEHVTIILAMDNAFIDTFFNKRTNVPEGTKAVPAPVAEMNGELFDAMWGE